MRFDLNVKGLKELKKDIHRYDRSIQRKMQREIASTAMRIHKDARMFAPSDTGVLRNKINMFVGNLAATVWSGAKYSIDVEKGQDPGTWPNPDELQGWVKRNLKVSKAKLKGVTFLVGRKIFKRGTKAQPFFVPAVEINKSKFFNNMRRIVMQTKA